MISVEVAPNHNAFNGRDCNSDHVMDVCQELSDSDFTFPNVLGGLSFPITVTNQIAFLNVPSKHRFPRFQS